MLWELKVEETEEGFIVRMQSFNVEAGERYELGVIYVRLNDFAEISVALNADLDEKIVEELIKFVEERSGRDKFKVLIISGKIHDVLEDIGYIRDGFYYVKI